MAEANASPTALQTATPTQNGVAQTENGAAPAATAATDWEAQAKALRADLDKKTKENVIERRKWSASQKAEREGLSSKLSRLGELEKEKQEWAKDRQLAKLNPPAHFQSVYGEKWQDVVRDVLVNGVAPGDLVASEIQRLRDEFSDREKSRDAERQKTDAEAGKRAEQEARRALHYEALEFYRGAEKEYPIFRKLGDARAVANAISARIEREYHNSAQQDEETGEMRPGRVIVAKEAADLLEADLLAIVEEAASHEKYQPKLREKLQPANASATVASSARNGSTKQSQVEGSQQQASQQPRRTLSNNLTGSTPSGRAAPTTDAERLERALAARNAAIASRTR